MQKGEKQRRSNRRMPVVLPVRWRRPEGDQKVLQTENISTGGMLLRSHHFVPTDRSIDLAIDLPGQERELHATAQARFVGPAADGFVIGVQIMSMPPDEWKLWRRWCQQLPGASAGAETSQIAKAVVRSSANILLVASALPPEIVSALVANGYGINVVRDPLEALNLLRKRQDFEILICDVRRSDLDGRSLCDLIKQDRALRDVHVLLLAEHDAEKDLIDGIEAGATYVVTRPFTEEFFLSLITLCQRG